MSTQEKLAVCPCCGAPARVSGEWQDCDGNWAIECSVCNLLSWTPEDWNRRVSEHGGGGEAVAWRFRVVAPNGNKGKWVLTDEPSVSGGCIEVEPLYSRPPTPSAGVGDGFVMLKIKTTKGGRRDGKVTWLEVPATRVSEHFAVNPEILYPNADSPNSYLTGDFVATHIPSGMIVARSEAMESVTAAAQAMAALPVDWANLTPEGVKDLPADVMAQINVLRAAASIEGDIYPPDDALQHTAAPSVEDQP